MTIVWIGAAFVLGVIVGVLFNGKIKADVADLETRIGTVEAAIKAKV